MVRIRKLRRMMSRQKPKYKHIVDVSSVLANFSTGTNSALIIEGKDNPSSTTATDVRTSSSVKALFFELNVANGVTGSSNTQVVDWYVIYNPQDQIGFPDPTAVGSSNAKSYVMKQGMEMVTINNSVKKIGLIRIPRKYQKFNQNDKLYVCWKTRSNTGAFDSFCFKVIFKEVLA